MPDIVQPNQYEYVRLIMKGIAIEVKAFHIETVNINPTTESV